LSALIGCFAVTGKLVQVCRNLCHFSDGFSHF